MVCRALNLHAKTTGKIMVPIAFNGLNASCSALIVDPAGSVLAGDAPSPTHDGEANL